VRSADWCRGQAVREPIRRVGDPLGLCLFGPLVLLGGMRTENGRQGVEFGGRLVDMSLLRREHGAGLPPANAVGTVAAVNDPRATVETIATAVARNRFMVILLLGGGFAGAWMSTPH
jgi:hypothetical protein